MEDVFRGVCLERGAKLYKTEAGEADIIEYGLRGQVFNYKNYESLKISLLGEHQVKNAVTAIRTIEVLNEKGFTISEQAMRSGLIKAKWPGRLEVLREEPLFMIDGAHNIEGAKSLSEALTNYFPNRRIIFILGVLKDKDYKGIIECVAPLAYGFITVTPKSDRALPAEELSAFLKDYCKMVLTGGTIERAIELSFDACDSNDLICAFGSLYYIGEVRKYLRE